MPLKHKWCWCLAMARMGICGSNWRQWHNTNKWIYINDIAFCLPNSIRIVPIMITKRKTKLIRFHCQMIKCCKMEIWAIINISKWGKKEGKRYLHRFLTKLFYLSFPKNFNLTKLTIFIYMGSIPSNFMNIL